MTLHAPKPMRNFTLLWFGQVISTIGSYMTQFSVKLWLWDQTEQATTLTAMSLLSVVSGLVMAGVAGILVDRWHRKGVLFASDGVAAGVTLGLLLLFWSDRLHLWHFYIGEIVQGAAGEVQFLAYSSATAAMLTQQDYSRASSMNAAIHYSAIIFAPAIAGTLYPQIGFGGIAMIDLATFGVGMATLLWASIPSTARTSTNDHPSSFKQTLQSINQAFDGFRYLANHRGLFTLLGVSLGFEFAHELGSALYTPMILARSQNDSAVLGTVNAAAG
ncbi:MAG TPA: MFS transporter, partial [Stenomitos sp.]